ncbi:PTS sugar transporter subunit IIC [Vagococcus sp. BWB3-3]|uniref:Permease IIC component n=1 Tax=Vagococcus allomyrinae TaxID=2794353 RepID=A0A940ST80_9ENTE|nr:PTS transporter subunit EIIC [Vagococcus allomyrinae]MBP1042837.1 PTS sugar transporter subunit IIC [Vagococcus allomyrinae]
MSSFDKVQEKLQKTATIIQGNKYVSAITNGLISALPVTIVGALGSLVNTLPIDAYQRFLETSGLKSITGVPTMVTTNLLSLYVVFLIAAKFADGHKLDGTPAGLLALMAFLIITPLGNTTTSITTFLTTNKISLPDGVEPSGGDFLPLDWLGAAGLFTAFIVALLSAQLYVIFKEKGWGIKMPAGVPPTVSKSFSSLVPGVVLAVIAATIRFLMSLTAFEHLHAAIFAIIATPLKSLGGSIWAMVIAILVSHILWICGVHGSLVIYSVFAGIWVPMQMENLSAFNSGQAIPNMVSMSLFGMVGFMGSGATVGLAVAMLRAKSEQYRTLGRIAIIPNLCGINEPLIFGLPIIMNFTLAIPFIVMPLLILLGSFIGMATGILPYLTGVAAPLGTPVLLSGLLLGGWKWLVFQVLMLVISYFMYLPFFKVTDKIAYQSEMEAAREQE